MRKKFLSILLENNQNVLREGFYHLRNPEDIATLLEIPYKILVYHLYLIEEDKKYKEFDISKKLGGVRHISTPVTNLKIIQKKLNQVLQAVYEPKASTHGFVLNKNIVTNAKVHANKRYVLNIDLKDFFPSINFGRVRGMFMAIPYGLNPDIATVLAQICCHDNQLPQGAPTSPIVSNMICAKMDSQLQRLAKKCKSTYTRYADDITFSTTLPIFPEELAYIVIEDGEEQLVLGDNLLNIIFNNGFEINESKIRLQLKGNHQEVTGLTVNQFPNVDRRFVRQVRAMLHAWAKFGLEATEREYNQKYNSKDRLPIKKPANFKQILRGKIEFIGMVKGKNNPIYQKLLQQYQKLHTNFDEQRIKKFLGLEDF